LPADWLMRAQGALSDASLADVPLAALFLRRNLLPWTALIAVAFALAGTARADVGAEAYRAGSFKAAEAAWRQAVVAGPGGCRTADQSLARTRTAEPLERIRGARVDGVLSPTRRPGGALAVQLGA